jgi:AraC family transcriptional regulator
MAMRKNDVEHFQDIKHFIDANLTRSINIQDMCRRFVINRTKLQQGFQEFYCSSVYAYVIRRRMELAAERILATDDSIKSIALDSGYRQQRSFNKAFKSIYRESPAAYRKKNQSFK